MHMQCTERLVSTTSTAEDWNEALSAVRTRMITAAQGRIVDADGVIRR